LIKRQTGKEVEEMKRKYWCVLSLALMVLVMLSGCNGMDLDKEWWKKI